MGMSRRPVFTLTLVLRTMILVSDAFHHEDQLIATRNARLYTQSDRSREERTTLTCFPTKPAEVAEAYQKTEEVVRGV